MSNRTLVELNHDYCPHTEEEIFRWAEAICHYMSSGDPERLPYGVTFKNRRHHSDTCPLETLKKEE